MTLQQQYNKRNVEHGIELALAYHAQGINEPERNAAPELSRAARMAFNFKVSGVNRKIAAAKRAIGA